MEFNVLKINKYQISASNNDFFSVNFPEWSISDLEKVSIGISICVFKLKLV